MYMVKVVCIYKYIMCGGKEIRNLFKNKNVFMIGII